MGISVHNFSDSPFSKGIQFYVAKNLSCYISNTHKTNDGRKLIVNIEFCQNYYNDVNTKQKMCFLKENFRLDQKIYSKF